MRAFLFCLLLFSVSVGAAQDSLRYHDRVFRKITRKKNIFYGSNGEQNLKAHRMDLYYAAGDTNPGRPVIVLMHGGGFKFGSKNNSRMHIWGKEFARRGYVVAAINYRHSSKKPLSRFEDLAEACADGTEDARKAIIFLKQQYSQLGIDTSKIIIGGHSAGGMIALQSVYSSREEIMRMINKQNGAGSQPPSVGTHNPENVIAVINFWGAVYDTAWLKNSRVPIVSVHGSKDRVVPFNFGEAPIYGSGAINRVATRLGIINDLKIFSGKGHELQKHFNPLYAGPVARKRWRRAADFVSDFLYSRVLNRGNPV